ncbi:MAG: MBL fold metallo-hydrolase [Aestuariibacter sp.]
MQVKFWGTRGSIPVAPDNAQLQERIKSVLIDAVRQEIHQESQISQFCDNLPFYLTHSFGGNTSCVEIQAGQEDYILLDAGTGIRDFGGAYMMERAPRSKTFHILLSHLHWDHIMGFPFFTPAYIPGHKIIFYGCHNQIEETIRRQHSGPNFPVQFDALGADIEFVQFSPDEPISVAGLNISAYLQLHEGDSYGYRISDGDNDVVYSTDSEHKVDNQEELNEFVKFIGDADFVIFDAMYSLLDSVTLKEDWGHSSNLMGVELCLRANAKKLCLFHHDPTNSDEQLYNTLLEARNYLNLMENSHRLRIESAYDGLSVEI